MAHAKNHDYHILPPSIWPFLGSVGGFAMLFGAVLWMHDITAWLFWAGLAAVLYTMFGWWSEVVAESRQGDHTPVVRIGLRYGFILFVMSEVMFFFAWFWSFFKHAMYPMEEYVGTEYVAPEMYAVDPFHLPLINTVVLLLSGCAVTWAHHALVHNNDRKALIQGLSIGIVLGIFFTFLQGYEYGYLLKQGWAFGEDEFFSNFFMATGFHGAHVIIGTIFLTVCLIRALKGDFTPEAHVGFEAAAWYWHFVDVVWLFLFVAVYVWGTSGL
ncbi:cytochrome c oxidase subunit 3 [Phycobacter azelaicus]|jgi:cytochrome c oxidase subunit 3|uniref:cytochrome c oxidase subunit 3 n=1 Tax=Phycobacter azelaicus TaxID=2668075 RepID=UPI001867C5E0|nr:cytochrome c oxidase subunit 3 [Phycobacter azelaicus]MBE1296256.1 cytochrome c oxidase subunit 3 [Paracoccaceae bacterium]